MVVFDEQRHLLDREWSDGLHANGDVHHLGSDEGTVRGPFHAGQLDQHADVPLKVCLLYTS